MDSVVIGLLVLVMTVHINTEDINILDDILVHPIPAPAPMKKEKREISGQHDINEFIVEKLTQHSQALEHIVERVDVQLEIIKQLTENLGKILEKPNMPEKVSPKNATNLNTRRSNPHHEEKNNPVWNLGKNIPKYGRLAKDLFIKEIDSETDPTPLVEMSPDESSFQKSFRRSLGGGSEIDLNKPKDEPNSWCEAAILCKRTAESVCGFDDNYGYGKFDDICHMLHVNCYYKYNFVLAHTCHPTL